MKRKINYPMYPSRKMSLSESKYDVKEPCFGDDNNQIFVSSL